MLDQVSKNFDLGVEETRSSPVDEWVFGGGVEGEVESREEEVAEEGEAVEMEGRGDAVEG